MLSFSFDHYDTRDVNRTEVLRHGGVIGAVRPVDGEEFRNIGTDAWEARHHNTGVVGIYSGRDVAIAAVIIRHKQYTLATSKKKL